MTTPLQKTIFNLAMYGGSVQYYDGKIATIDPTLSLVTDQSLKERKVTLAHALSATKQGMAKPLLRSFNKLTESILDGKVPIVELFKIARGCYEMEIKDRYIDIKSSNEVQIELGYLIYHFGLFSFQNCDVRLGENYFFKMYKTNLRLDNPKEVQVYCQNILFNQLNAWGFNTENLPEDQFIEIETLKIK